MKLVILSGGVGKRLWPISNEAHSKQFLQVISGEGGPVSYTHLTLPTTRGSRSNLLDCPKILSLSQIKRK